LLCAARAIFGRPGDAGKREKARLPPPARCKNVETARHPRYFSSRLGEHIDRSGVPASGAARQRHGELTVLPGDSFHVAASDPDGCARAMLDFIARHPQR
jgi:hypothetical protein